MSVYIISLAEQISAIILFLRDLFTRTAERQRKIRKPGTARKLVSHGIAFRRIRRHQYYLKLKNNAYCSERGATLEFRLSCAVLTFAQQRR